MQNGRKTKLLLSLPADFLSACRAQYKVVCNARARTRRKRASERQKTQYGIRVSVSRLSLSTRFGRLSTPADLTTRSDVIQWSVGTSRQYNACDTVQATLSARQLWVEASSPLSDFVHLCFLPGLYILPVCLVSVTNKLPLEECILL